MSDEPRKIAIATGDEVSRFAGSAPSEPRPADAAPDPAALQAELAQVRDRLLRAQAECVNISRRLTEEKTQALRMAAAAFARDLLTVLDNFERTLDSLKDRPADDPVVQGIRLTYDSFLKVLRDHQIEPIESIGKPFDPVLHEALLQQETTDVPEGHVISEWSKGYRMHDRTLRPARVAVARRPEAPAAQPSAADTES